jgi:hypothetical protein
MHAAWCLAHRLLKPFSNKYSRRDFTLPQLFACLVVRELLGLSYRKLERFLRDSPDWLLDLGMQHVPDHNKLCRAAGRLLKEQRVRRLLDEQMKWTAACTNRITSAGITSIAKHDEAKSRQRPSRQDAPQPQPRPPLESSDPQSHDPQVKMEGRDRAGRESLICIWGE